MDQVTIIRLALMDGNRRLKRKWHDLNLRRALLHTSVSIALLERQRNSAQPEAPRR